MNCGACRELVQQAADGVEFLPDAALEQHVATCAECRSFRRGLRQLAEAARRSPCPAPPADFAARVTAAVLADRPRRTAPPHRTWLRPLLALAAALLVGAGILTWRWFTPAPTHAPAVVQLPPVPDLRESMREAGDALTALGSRTADEVVASTRKLIPSVTPPTLPTLDPMGPLGAPPGRALAQAGQTVAEGLEPVTNSAQRAFNLFLRDVPLGGAGPSGL